MPRPPFPRTLREFQSKFATEEACQEYLAACRWPDGFVCPRCGNRRAYELVELRRWQCTGCRHQVSLTAETILHNTRTPLTVSAHEEVAKAYDVPSVHLAAEVAREISAGELTWKDYGGVHPAPRGNRIAADMIDELFSRMWAGPVKVDAPASPHPMPENMLDPMSYAAGRFIDPAQATVVNGWTLAVPDWKSLPGSKRSRFASIPMLCATEPGAECTLAFTGTAVGAYVLAGPDAGALEASVDGGAFQNVNLYHRFSKGLHYPRTVMLATDLKPGDHALRLRVSDQTKSAGHAARIMQFVAN